MSWWAYSVASVSRCYFKAEYLDEILSFYLKNHTLACVSSSHPLVNVPQVFNRLRGTLEAETWLGFGLVVKNHISFTP